MTTDEEIHDAECGTYCCPDQRSLSCISTIRGSLPRRQPELHPLLCRRLADDAAERSQPVWALAHVQIPADAPHFSSVESG